MATLRETGIQGRRYEATQQILTCCLFGTSANALLFLRGLFPSKKFFWFGAEPVEAKSLSSYLRGEKAQDAASKNVAWAAYTGKGLLFFSKKATDKASPAGLFNLVC